MRQSLPIDMWRYLCFKIRAASSVPPVVAPTRKTESCAHQHAAENAHEESILNRMKRYEQRYDVYEDGTYHHCKQ